MADSVYLDHAATTPLEPEVFEAMRPFFTERFGNPSSVHGAGRIARHAIEESRERVAVRLGCEPAEVVFTSGGTEANNMAILGTLRAESVVRRGLITSAVEHESVLRAAGVLADDDHPVEVLSPGIGGRIAADRIRQSISGETGLVSIMWVNNELGTCNPVAEIAAVCRDHGVVFHTDAVQAIPFYASSTPDIGADLLSISAHKFGGPKGIGVLYVRSGTTIRPHVVGGGQERRRRAGTENVAGIVGLATALELAAERADDERARLTELRQLLAKSIQKRFQDAARLNTPEEPVAPHILNVSFKGSEGRQIDGEMLLLALDMAGVMVSSGSACTSGAVEVSHVLRAIDLDPGLAPSTVRFSFGRSTTPEHIQRAVDALEVALERQGLVAG